MSTGWALAVLFGILMTIFAAASVFVCIVDMRIREKRLIRASKLVSIYYRNLKQ